MLVQTQKYLTTSLAVIVVTILAGCGQSGFDSEFATSEHTQSLIREAQTGVGELPGVTDLVDERFGTPQDLQAWTRLPIDFGGTTGRVASAPDASAAVKELTLEFDEGTSIDFDPQKTLEIQFITGAAAPLTAVVSSWSAENRVASLTTALEAAPAAGDVIVLNGGEPLQHGRVLYMRHCAHCHGTTGDGQGPTAEYLVPRPRDYRHGVFKFTSTTAQDKASRDDLQRVLRNGVPGTYMPSFVPMLNETELHDVVEYVRFLTMRGEFERRMVNELAADYSRQAVETRKSGGESYNDIVKELKGFLESDLADSLEFVSDDLVTAWTNADTPDAVIVPTMARVPDSPDSRRRGRELYLSSAINCADCHGIAAEGNGPQTTIFEKNPVTQQLYKEPGLHDVWDHVNQPRNLRRGIYRGGRRPIDLFCRIQAGIKGSRMPSFKNLPHEDIWHIVNYVLSIPFEPEPGHGPTPSVSPAAEAAASL
ncbi:MAG: c-type cytochrome [Planctomycetaceae bacterium]